MQTKALSFSFSNFLTRCNSVFFQMTFWFAVSISSTKKCYWNFYWNDIKAMCKELLSLHYSVIFPQPRSIILFSIQNILCLTVYCFYYYLYRLSISYIKLFLCILDFYFNGEHYIFFLFLFSVFSVSVYLLTCRYW